MVSGDQRNTIHTEKRSKRHYTNPCLPIFRNKAGAWLPHSKNAALASFLSRCLHFGVRKPCLRLFFPVHPVSQPDSMYLFECRLVSNPCSMHEHCGKRSTKGTRKRPKKRTTEPQRHRGKHRMERWKEAFLFTGPLCLRGFFGCFSVPLCLCGEFFHIVSP